MPHLDSTLQRFEEASLFWLSTEGSAHRHLSSFLGLLYSILNMNHQKKNSMEPMGRGWFTQYYIKDPIR